MAHGIVSLIAILGLLGSGDACAWLCEVASTEAAVTDTGEGPGHASHCGDEKAPDSVPGELPSHEDCAGCGIYMMVSPGPELPAAVPVFAAAAPSWHASDGLAARSGLRTAPRVERAPPRDVLARTAVLRL